LGDKKKFRSGMCISFNCEQNPESLPQAMERRVVNVPANVEILIRFDDHPDACSKCSSERLPSPTYDAVDESMTCEQGEAWE